MLLDLLIYLLIGTIGFYSSTKAWEDDGYKWTKQWFILIFIISVILWPLRIIVGISLIIKFGPNETDRIITENSEKINIVEKIES